MVTSPIHKQKSVKQIIVQNISPTAQSAKDHSHSCLYALQRRTG